MQRIFRTTIFVFLACALFLLPIGPGTDQVFAQASKAYWKTSGTGGYDGCLDKVNGAVLNPGDMAVISDGYYFTPYALWESGSPVTEDPPWAIVPDLNPGNKGWMLEGIEAADFYTRNPYGASASITPGGIALYSGNSGVSPPIGASCTGWTLGTGWACGGSTTILKNADGTGTCVYNTAPTAGNYYSITINFSALSGGTVGVSFGGVTLPAIASTGSQTFYVLAEGTGNLTLTPSATGLRATLASASISDLFDPDDSGYIQIEGQIDVQNRVRVGLGSPLYPSLTSQYDEDTGFWFAPEGNQINLSIGGLKRFSFSDGSMTFITANGDNIIRASTAEGITNGSDIRVGVDKDERAFIICDVDDVGADFGIDAQGSVNLYVIGADAYTSARLSPSGLGFNTTGLVTFPTYGKFKFRMDNDLSSGHFFEIVQGSSGTAFIDTDGQQSVFQLSGEINQSGTAAYDGAYINITETTLGDGSTGAGNNLLRLAVGGTTRWKVSNTGILSGTFATNVDYGMARGATDTDITYVTLRNADGELCYVYPNATQDAIVVSATQP